MQATADRVLRLAYDPTKFVNREKELKVALEKAQRIVAGMPVERRVVVADGPVL